MKAKPVILAVDDLHQNVELLEAYLVPQGYEIIKAESGEEALEKFSGNQIDLVLLDIMMPNMSGFEVLERLRADEKTRLIPVVIITALKETEDRVKAIEAGCDDFISKPIDKHELLARVKSLLRIKSLHDEADEAREYAESVINTVREPLIALDWDLRVVKVSRSFYEFFKVNPEETVGRLIYDLGDKQWDIPKLRELLENILPQKTTFDNYEVEHVFAGIGRRTMLLNARQIQRGPGEEKIILLAIEDVTEIKKAEQNLRELDGIKDVFLSITAHELKSPLTPIQIQAQMLLAEKYGKINPEQKNSFEIILRNSERLIRLIDDVMTIAKIDQKRLECNKAEEDLTGLISGICSDMETQAAEKNLYLTAQLPKQLPKVYVDRNRIQQAVSDLLNNAIKFTDAGGITISAEPKDDFIQVAVKDTGMGIPPEELGKLFLRFSQIDRSKNPKHKGTGLGLSIVKSIIEMHGGRTWAESEGLNKGTTFYFTLPVYKKSKQGAAAAPDV
jgi:two-component system CheB/CheR fusion protein